MKLDKTILKETTSIGGSAGDSPTTGFFIGPFTHKPLKRKLYKSINDNYLYNGDGEKLTKDMLREMLYEAVYSKTPFKNELEPLCEAFPYCDKSKLSEGYLRLIEGNSDGMCKDCYEYCNTIGKYTNNSAEYIAEIINKKYKSL